MAAIGTVNMHEEAFTMLKELLASGGFHHATYRDFGKCWEGLAIYKQDEKGCRGFTSVCIIGKDSPHLIEAEELVRRTGTGISVGSYGNG